MEQFCVERSPVYSTDLTIIVPKGVQAEWKFSVNSPPERQIKEVVRTISRYALPFMEKHNSREKLLHLRGGFSGPRYESRGCGSFAVPILLYLTGQKRKAREVLLHKLKACRNLFPDGVFTEAYVPFARAFMKEYFDASISLPPAGDKPYDPCLDPLNRAHLRQWMATRVNEGKRARTSTTHGLGFRPPVAPKPFCSPQEPARMAHSCHQLQ